VNEHEMRRVADILELQAVKAAYCESADSCVTDAPGASRRFAELFTPDVAADYGFGPLSGCKAVTEFLVNAIAGNNAGLWHALHTPRIEVDGDTAVGRWTVMAKTRPKGAAQFETVFGRYTDEFRRTPQGWRISSVRFIQER
jgi:ketosteroid isomerase-like protein